MGAPYDPNIELEPNKILMWVAILVLAGFGTVFMIVKLGDTQADAATAGP